MLVKSTMNLKVIVNLPVHTISIRCLWDLWYPASLQLTNLNIIPCYQQLWFHCKSSCVTGRLVNVCVLVWSDLRNHCDVTTLYGRDLFLCNNLFFLAVDFRLAAYMPNCLLNVRGMCSVLPLGYINFFVYSIITEILFVSVVSRKVTIFSR